MYVSPNNQLRIQLWDNVIQFISLDDKLWMVAGDFNDIANVSERRGHVIALEDCRIQKFNDNVNNYGLMDLGALGLRMTRSNDREGFTHTLKRLDQAFGNGKIRVKFPDAVVTNLPQKIFDHNSLLINLTGTNSNSLNFVRPFRIESMWFTHPDFKDLVSFNWLNCNNDHLTAINKLADSTKNWNNNGFVNLFRRKRRTLARLAEVQKAKATMFSSNLEFLERELRKDYLNILNQEEIMWQQKLRNDWIVEGDRNTQFFHITTLLRRKRNRISMLKDGNGGSIIVMIFKSI